MLLSFNTDCSIFCIACTYLSVNRVKTRISHHNVCQRFVYIPYHVILSCVNKNVKDYTLIFASGGIKV